MFLFLNIFRSPVLRTQSICFAHVFFCQLTFSDVRQPVVQAGRDVTTFSKLLHRKWLYPHRKRCYVDFLKVLTNKNEERKPQISPNFASNRNILNAVTRNVERRQSRNRKQYVNH